MGVFRVRIRIASPSNPEVTRDLEAVVDTGSAYTLIPRTVAEALGIRPVRKMAARLANGDRIVRDMGEAVLTIDDLRTTTWVVFGDPEDAVLLGAVTLQELALEVDPTAERLRPGEIYMFGAAWNRVRLIRSTRAALRKILHMGLEGHRRERALRLLSQRTITLSKAAKIAKVSVWEMLSLAGDRHITWVDDDLMEDLRGHPSVRRS